MNSLSCPSRLQMERYHHGELGEVERDALKSHVRECTRCEGMLARFQSEDQAITDSGASAFAANLVDRYLAQDTSTSSTTGVLDYLRRLWGTEFRWGWAAGLSTAMVVLAVGVLTLRANQKTASTPRAFGDEEVLFKGGASLTVHRKQADRVDVLSPSSTVNGNDQLRFEVRAPGYSHVIVVGLEASGAAAIYAPFGGQGSLSLPSGQERTVLPGGITLDDSHHDELVVAVFSHTALDAQAVLAAAKKAFGRSATGIHNMGPLGLKGTLESRFYLKKGRGNE